MIGNRNSISIDIISSNTTFSIKLYDRINIISGLSGTGKTRLCNLILDMDSPEYRVDYKDSAIEHIILYVRKSNADLGRVIKDNKNTLIISDEGSYNMENMPSYIELVKYLNINNNILLFMDRGGFVYPVMPHSMCRLISSGDCIKTDSIRYDFCKALKGNLNLTCEGSSLGMVIYSNILNSIGNTFKGNSGNNKIVHNQLCMDSSKNKQLVYIYDGVGFGGQYESLVDTISNNKGNEERDMMLLSPPSFEYLLLVSSNILDEPEKELIDVVNVFSYKESFESKYDIQLNEFVIKSYERYCTYIVKAFCDRKFNYEHDKSNKLTEAIVVDKEKFKEELFKRKNLYWIEEMSDNVKTSIEQFYDKFLH